MGRHSKHNRVSEDHMNVSKLVQQQAGSTAVKDRASFHVAACVTAFAVTVSRVLAQPHLYVTINVDGDEVPLPLIIPQRESFGRISQRVRTLTRGKLPLFINSYTIRCEGFAMLCEQGPSGKWYFSVKAPSSYDENQAYVVKTDFLNLLEQGLRNPIKPLNRLVHDAKESNNAFFRYLSTLR